MSARHSPRLSETAREQAARRDTLESVILVDTRDREQGSAGKLEAHRAGLLHRAFSILVFDARQRLLLQQRADAKYHFAGYWSNSCCGHPRPGEATPDAAGRRLHEEFGIRVALSERAQLVYRAEDAGSGLVEHEYLHIFHGIHAGDPAPDPSEIGAWRWMTIPAIRRAIAMHPDWFTPWFRLLVERHLIPLAGGGA